MVNQPNTQTDIFERSVLFLGNLIKRNFLIILLAGLIGGIIGGSLSFLLPKKYTSRAQLLPEYKESRLSGFSSLASLAGVDITNSAGSDAIRPDLYPNILQSTPAIMYLLKQPVKTSTKVKYNRLIDYLEKDSKTKVPLPEILSSHSPASVLNFSKREIQLISSLKSKIASSFDKKTGIIGISVEMPDPVVAATTVSHTVQYITYFVSNYRYQKKHEQTEFLKTRVQEANKQLQKSEYALQRYRDNNRNLFMNVAKIEEQKLQSNYLHAQNLRNDLIIQLEKSAFAEKEELPVFQVLEPPIVSLGKSGPNRMFFAVTGAVLATLLIVIALSFRKKATS